MAGSTGMAAAATRLLPMVPPGAPPERAGAGAVPAYKHMTVVVVEPEASIRGPLAAKVGAIPLAAVDDVTPALQSGALVLVVGPSLVSSGELEVVEEVVGSRANVAVLLVANEVTPDLIERCLRVGVRDVLPTSATGAKMVDAVTRAGAGLSRAGGGGQAPLATEGAVDLGRVISVFSTKGGVGKSVVAVNVALCLAEDLDQPVLLLDADLQFGDVAVMLALEPERSVVEAINGGDILEPTALRKVMSTDPESGLMVLSAPPAPTFADQIAVDDMLALVRVLRTMYAAVVIDLPASFSDVVLALVASSDDVLMVAGLDLPSVKNVGIGFQTLRLLGTPPEKLHLVLNRANSNVGLGVDQAEASLGVKAETLIPSDVVVPKSVNDGVPVVRYAPTAAVSLSLRELATRLSDAITASAG
jgi:pilus assembly protein CpaE